MPEYVAENFWSEVEKYYESKAPYTKMMLDAASREPSEEDKAAVEGTIPRTTDEKDSLPDTQADKNKTSSPKDKIDEILHKAMRDFQLQDMNGSQELVRKQTQKP